MESHSQSILLAGHYPEDTRAADSESGVLCNIAPEVPRPTASASPRSLFWMQKLRPQPRPTELKSAFEQDLQAIQKFARD